MSNSSLEPFEWSDDYATGIRLIDTDHRELFTIIEDLRRLVAEQALGRNLREVTERLTRYAQDHFEREENLMAEYNYPGIAEHRQRHNDFVRMIYAIRKVELDRPDLVDTQKLHAFLMGWLRRHILHADRDYIPYLTGAYGRRKSDLTSGLDDAAAPRADEKGEAEAMISVTVQVPASQKATLRRCARLLRMGGDNAAKIEQLTDPISNMTLEDALVIAKIILREPQPA